jgi:hypothetical protein
VADRARGRRPALYPGRMSTPGGGDAERRVDVTVSPPTVEIRVEGHAVRISLRSYLSSHLLWTARHEAKLAEKIEAAHVAGRTRFSIEHRARVLSSIVASVAFLEAMINELYQDAADGHAPKGGHITPLSLECRQLMAELWQSTSSGMLEVIEKYERLLLFAHAPQLDRGGQVYENTRLVLRLRNAIVHFRPEDRSAEDELNKLQKGLQARGFADNALMGSSGNPWWPDKALGYGAAEWAHRSVQALADHVSDAIGIVPIYRKVEAGGWFGQTPGEVEP